MKRPLKLFLRFVAAIALIAIVMIGLEMRRLWMGYHDTVIIATGPFASRFACLYPNNPKMEKEIEQWFLEVIPVGTTREEARKILLQSFTIDLTSERMTKIDGVGSIAGGSSTSVRLHFDNRGRLDSVEVDQESAYL